MLQFFLTMKVKDSLNILKTGLDRAISMNFLTCRACVVISWVLPEIIFLPFLAAILKFCVKYKNAFISETVLDRTISTNFFGQGITE